VENRSGDQHVTVLRLAGLKPGSYQVMFNGKQQEPLAVEAGGWSTVHLAVDEQGLAQVEIMRTSQ
jgi:hypothetical protein